MLYDPERILHAAHVVKDEIEDSRTLEIMALQGSASSIFGLPCPEWLQRIRRGLYLDDKIAVAKARNQGRYRVAKRLVARAHNAVLAEQDRMNVSSLDFGVVRRYY